MNSEYAKERDHRDSALRMEPCRAVEIRAGAQSAHRPVVGTQSHLDRRSASESKTKTNTDSRLTTRKVLVGILEPHELKDTSI